MSEPNLSSDRHFDLSLRLLTMFVLVSLALCVAFLTRSFWIGPFTSAEKKPDSQAIVPAAVPQPATVAAPAPQPAVLMDARKTFRCDDKGRVSFSDRACVSGDEKVLPLNSIEGTGGSAGSSAPNAPGAPGAGSAAPGTTSGATSGSAPGAPSGAAGSSNANDRTGR